MYLSINSPTLQTAYFRTSKMNVQHPLTPSRSKHALENPLCLFQLLALDPVRFPFTPDGGGLGSHLLNLLIRETAHGRGRHDVLDVEQDVLLDNQREHNVHKDFQFDL